MFVFKLALCFFSIITSINSDDYYDLLGISKDADNREIRRAFKKLALKLHPDKNMGEDKAHEQFIAVNKAYEVLKNEETRKKYDLHGEEGLKQDFGKSWKGSYRSWNYYYESFGIYDDDPEIVTLNKHDFWQLVLESSDFWFINFYSPQCSHCHDLAPIWRQIASKLEGVLQIGAVNCEEDWVLCREQHIYSYPSLVIYPKKERYQGYRDLTSLMQYILELLPNNVVQLNSANFPQIVAMKQYEILPWLIFTCKDAEGCIESDDLKKLGVILEHLVNVAEVVKNTDKDICKIIDCRSSVSFYYDLISPSESKKNHFIINDVEISEVVKMILTLLPDPEEFNEENYLEMRRATENLTSTPRLLQFRRDKTGSSEPNVNLKRLKALVPAVILGYFNCQKYPNICNALYLQKLPAFILFKPGKVYEFHYGKQTTYEVARFVHEALASRVETLVPDHFPTVLTSSQPWFIDFFAPWCPPCMQLLPHWRKASQSSGHLVKFGTVDCSIHNNFCRQYHIKSYPTVILYNQSMPHKFYGSHSQQQIEEFIQDILHPLVISISPTTFMSLVTRKSKEEIWIIDFFAPWCGPCQQLAPEWKKLAKLVKNVPLLHVGQVDCEDHKHFCTALDISSYPTIRLYQKGDFDSNQYITYKGWNRDASSLQSWVHNYLPSKVTSLSSHTYKQVLLDSSPWLIDYYVPWCSHCVTFAPELEKIAVSVEGRVKIGKVNCEQFPRICKLASIKAYPTVMFYSGNKENHSQNPIGIEIDTLSFKEIYSFLEKVESDKFQSKKLRDEL